MNNKLPMIFYVKIFRNLRHINQDTPHSSGLRYLILRIFIIFWHFFYHKERKDAQHYQSYADRNKWNLVMSWNQCYLKKQIK